MTRFVLWKLFFFMFWSIYASAQDAPERLHLLPGADKLVRRMENGEPVQIITGHVHLKQGDSELKCDIARFWEKKNYAILNGNVFIDDGEHRLYSDHATYDGDQKIEHATGNVRLLTDGRELTSRVLTYYQQEKRTLAKSDVVIRDFIRKAVLKGQSADYYREKDYALIEGRPEMSVVDTTAGDTLRVNGLKMEGWGETQEVLVTDSVAIFKGGVAAKCQQALFNIETDWITLMRLPQLWQDDQHMTGDTIKIHLVENEIKGGEIIGRARIVSTDSTKSDELTGQKITINTVDDSTRHVIVEGQATSIYHVSEDEGDPGVNEASGDRIEMIIQDSKLQWIKVDSDPGMSAGKFEPEEQSVESVESGRVR